MKWTRMLDALLFACIIAVLSGVFIADVSPSNGLELAGRPLENACVFRLCFHSPCPFCGLARSIVALAHGRILMLLSFHPLGPLVVIAFAVFGIAAGLSFWRGFQPVVESRVFAKAAIVLAIASLALWLLRTVCPNLPCTTSMVPK